MTYSNTFISKIINILDFLADSRFVAVIALLHSLVSASVLYYSDYYINAGYILIIWASFMIIWNLLIRKKTDKRQYLLFILLFILCEFIGLSVNEDAYGGCCLLENIVLFSIFIGLEKENNNWVMNTYLVGTMLYNIAGVCAIYSQIHEFYGEEIGIQTVTNTFVGISENTNQMGAVNLCAIMFAVYLIADHINKNRKKSIILYVLSIIIDFVFIILSHSRTVIITLVAFGLALLLTLPGCLIQNKKIKRTVYIIIIIFIIIIAGAGLALMSSHVEQGNYSEAELYLLKNQARDIEEEQYDSVYQLFSTRLSEFSGRMPIWQYGLKIIRLQPIFGPGWETTEHIMYYYLNQNWFAHMHNGFLQILMCEGILGLIFSVPILILITIQGIKKVSKNRKTTDLILLVAFLSLVLVQNFAEIAILTEIRAVSLTIWTMAGILCASCRHEQCSSTLRH